MGKNPFCMQPALRLHRLSALLEKAADHALHQELDLTFSQCMILLSLRDNPDCSQRSIARCRDLTQAAVSRQTEMLCEKGLLTREENERNRREHVLALTAKGTRLLEKGMEIVTAKFEAGFACLTQGETGALRASVDKLLDSMRSQRKGDGCCDE